jgi:hypothetical protein
MLTSGKITSNTFGSFKELAAAVAKADREVAKKLREQKEKGS